MKLIVVAHRDGRIGAALQEMLLGILEEIHLSTEVLSLGSLEEIRELIYQCGSALIIIDEELFNLNELSLLKSDLGTSIACVLMTKSSFIKNLKRRVAKKNVIDHVLPKPLDREEVKRMLKRRLANHDIEST